MTALKAEGLRVADLARHSTYLQEFMWEVLTEGHPEGRCLTVMDLGGMCLPRLTSSDTAELIRTSSGVLDAHYPGRISRILVVNAPGWVARVWSVIAGLMPQTLREKIHVTRDLAELREFIDPAQLPTSYGGTDPTPPGQSAEERLLQEMVAEVRAGRRPPALRALHARRRAAKAAASTAGAGAGVTAAGGEEAAAAMVAPPAVELALPSSARPAGGSASGSSAESPPSPATWPAAAPDAAAPPLPAGKKGRRATKGWGGSSSSGSGKPPTPFRARSPFARAWFANRAQQQQEQWPASMSLLRVGGSPASWPPQGQAGEENGSKQRKEDAKVLAIPSRSPPSGSGSSKGSKGSKGFWRRRGRSQTPSPRVEAPVPSPAS